MAPESFQWQQPEKRVDVAAMERELDRLFHEGGALIRAAMLNLVSVCTCGEEISRVMETATRIVAHHPARVLLLDLCAGENDPVTATLSATCFRTGGEGKQVCCEVILLRGGGADPHPLISAVLALLVPDLPVILWWSGETDLCSRFFETLTPFLDGMIFDSRDLSRWPSDLSLLTRLLRAPSPPWIGDLAWYRIAPWRKLTAELFEPQESRSFLPAIQEVRLTFVRRETFSPAAFSDAVLYAAWIARSLGWQIQEPLRPENGDRSRMTVRKGEGTAAFQFSSVPPPAGSSLLDGMLREAVLIFQTGEGVRTFRMELDPERNDRIFSPSAADHFEVESSIPALLCQALEEIGRTGDYPKVIELTPRIVPR